MENRYNNDENFNNLIQKFIEINKLGYIKAVNNNLFNACGLTFEKLLDKSPDSMYFPDYKDIEIKCKQRFSRYDITLFSISFDGPTLFESNYILQTYGKYDDNFTDKKVLFVNLLFRKKVLVNDKYFFELNINYKEKYLYVNIYDIKMKLLEKRCFIDFDNIERRMKLKLNKLAVVNGSKKKIYNYLYFRYYKITCYQFKSFDNFIKAIEDGKVKLSIILRFAKSGIKVGKNKNKNMIFTISQKDLNYIYDELYTYEN